MNKKLQNMQKSYNITCNLPYPWFPISAKKKKKKPCYREGGEL